jgi:hypothetical protein
MRGRSITFELTIRRRIAFTELLAAVPNDADPDAQQGASAVLSWLTRFWSTPERPDCFVCGSRLVVAPAAIFLLLPLRRAGRKGIAGGLCPACCSLPDSGLSDAVMASIKKMMLSAELRVSPAHGGRA